MITVQLTGVQKAIQNMKLDPQDLRQALAESGLNIEGDAKQICTNMGAVDTGRLRASISTALDGEGRGVVHDPVAQSQPNDGVEPPKKDSSCVAILRIGSSVDYAWYIIGGTKRMIGRDFLTPAVYQNLSDIQARIKSKIKQ